MGFSKIACINHHGHLVAVWTVLCYVVQVTVILKTDNKTYQTILKSNLRNIRVWTSKADWEKLCFMRLFSSCRHAIATPPTYLNKRVHTVMWQT